MIINFQLPWWNWACNSISLFHRVKSWMCDWTLAYIFCTLTPFSYFWLHFRFAQVICLTSLNTKFWFWGTMFEFAKFLFLLYRSIINWSNILCRAIFLYFTHCVPSKGNIVPSILLLTLCCFIQIRFCYKSIFHFVFFNYFLFYFVYFLLALHLFHSN